MYFIKKTTVFIFAILLIKVMTAQEIPAERLVDWSLAGVKTNIPSYSNIYNILDYGGNPDGITSNNAAYTAALNAIKAGSGGGTIYFPAGTYFFADRIGIKDSVILKGDGSKVTQLKFNLASATKDLIIAGGTENNTNHWLSQAITKGQTFLISPSASTFTTGQWLRLMSNDSSLVNDSWAHRTTGQILQIKRISGDTIITDSPIRRNYTIAESPRVHTLNPVKNVGIENLYIERLDETTNQTSNILYSRVVNSWILGVESNKANMSHISLDYCSNVTIRGCYIHDAFSFGSGGKAYGIVFQYGTGECLVEDNVFNKLRHSTLFQAGPNGNVVGYNYSINPYWDEVLSPSNSAGDIVMHGNYPYSNLAEGNINQQIVVDNSHKINGPYNTFFRNKLELYGIFMNASAGNSQNYVGNDITNTGAALGLYTITGNDHFQYGNRRKNANTVVPSGTTNLTRTSYYLCAKPAYWNAVSYSWPSIGIPYEFKTGENPASTRWKAGATTAYSADLRIRNSSTGVNWYQDSDNDSYGNPAVSIVSCIQPAGYVANNQDCDDTKASINPTTVWYEDKDGDKYSSGNTQTACIRPTGFILAAERLGITIDCNDNDAAIHPGATEICDGKDNNCNASTDEGVSSTWYQDSDNDTYGNPAVSQQACTKPAGYVSNNQDCDDTKASINPITIWYEDKDGDKYSSGNTQTACIRPTGYILAAERLGTAVDCNDNDAAIHPGATEICDGKDNNCNASTDEGATSTWYQDSDNDTYGNPAVSQQACTKPAGYVANNQDCDDTKAVINPNTVWYEDKDGDKYSTGITQTTCVKPSGYILASEKLSDETDCNDNDAAIHPNATEIADDGIDQDCKDGDLISTSIKDRNVFGLNVFPNPSEGHLIVQCNITEKGNYTLRITDIQGRIISENEMFLNYGNQQVQVNISQKGFYILQLENQQFKSIQKIIIK